MPIQVGVAGFSGRTGTILLDLLEQDSRFEVVNLITRNKAKYHNHKYQSIIVEVDEVSPLLDAIIDFSNPEFTMCLLQYTGIPIVIATTGFTEYQLKIILDQSKNKAILLSSNMSISVNILFNLTSILAKKMQDYDIEIIETHHRNKLDAPSGTALTLFEEIKRARPHSVINLQRHTVKHGRDINEVGISSIRAGNIVGKHEVLFANNNEQLSVTSDISSRECFATGAIVAAIFIIQQPPGLYSMQDVLFGDAI